MGNKYSVTARFDAQPDRLVEAASYAFTQMKLRGVKWSPEKRILTGRTAMTWRSFGEKVSATVSDQGEVEVKSRCLIPTTVVDYGKNEENCERLVALMRAFLAAENPEQVNREFLAVAATRNKLALRYAVLIGIIAGICSVGGSIVAHRMLAPSIDSQIATACKEVSRKCPMMADRYTRLDTCLPGTGKQIIYSMTLVKLPIPDADRPRFFGEMKKLAANKCRSTPATNNLLGRGVTLTYRYYDEKGTLLTEFDVK